MTRLLACWLVAALLLAGCGARAPEPEPEPEPLSHGLFENLRLFRPGHEARGAVLLLSGERGWDNQMDQTARALAAQGALVTGIETPRLYRALESDPGDCVFPDGDLENLSHFVQGYARLAGYFRPLLAGVGEGGALAYAILAAAPPGIFEGGLSIGFRPRLELHKPLCHGQGVSLRWQPGARRSDLLPAATGAGPWRVLQLVGDGTFAPTALRAFVHAVPGARLEVLAGADDASVARRLPAGLVPVRGMAAAGAPPPPALADLPLIEVPATRASDSELFAVLLSGDGGWAGLDQAVATALAARGIPVVGLDSLRYFWTARTPQGLAADLDRVLAVYPQRWQRRRVLLIGYSQGADVLPFALNRLAPASRARVARTVLMALGEKAAFEFHLDNWIGGDRGAIPILPEAARLDAGSTLCLYGEQEAGSLCPRIPAGHVQAASLPGGHHFDGDHEALATRILAGLG